MIKATEMKKAEILAYKRQAVVRAKAYIDTLKELDREIDQLCSSSTIMNSLKKISIAVCMFAVAAVLFNGCKNGGDDTNGKTTAAFNLGKTYETMTDQDGNEYETITIGTQTWMAENLRTTHYRNGEDIPEVTDNTAWTRLSTGAYCNYNNTRNSDTIATYGRLYNWYAVSDSRNICPKGWHVPTNADWITLITYLGGDSVAGGKMKETRTAHWITPNTGASNESGFTALPGGGRDENGAMGSVGSDGYWWSSTGLSTIFVDYVWYWSVHYNDSYVSSRNIDSGKNGYSVRCVKN